MHREIRFPVPYFMQRCILLHWRMYDWHQKDVAVFACRCIEKDNFLMKIAENRKLYGDMEHIARAGTLFHRPPPPTSQPHENYPDGL